MKYLVIALLLLAAPAQASEYTEGLNGGFLSNDLNAPSDSSSAYKRGFEDSQADADAQQAKMDAAKAEDDAVHERRMQDDSQSNQ